MSKPRDTYIICTTARSGSNLFCDYLRNTRVLGRPGEALNPDIVRGGRFGERFPTNSPVSVRKYIEWMLANHRSRNGIFGIKILFEDFEFYKGFDAFQELMASSFLVHLRRRSKVRQAISYYFAEETGQWVHTDPARKRIEDVAFDYNRLEQHLIRLTRQDAMWQTYLNGLRLPYREVHFEEFVRDPGQELGEICRCMGFEPAVDMPVTATLQEQKNPRSAEFTDAFIDGFRAKVYGPTASVTYKNLTLVP